MIRRTPTSTLFPYTTLFRSNGKLLGTFGLHHTKAHPVAGDELALLEQAEHIALIAIERDRAQTAMRDRKSTRLNSSHRCISYAVFCLKKKKKNRLTYEQKNT